MAFGKGNISVPTEFKRYIGVASVFVKAVNPSKSELEEFYGREQENAPEYLSTVEENGAQVKRVRIDFLVQADPKKYEGVDLKSRVSFFLTRAPRVSKDGKKQIIDKYGRTAWATPEEISNHKVPVYSNGKTALISPDYRVAYNGEENLIKFLRTWLGIHNPQKYVDGNWVMVSEKELPDCESQLEHIEDYFNGKFNELNDLLKLYTNFPVKIIFGIRTADDGKQYQAVCNRYFIRNGAKDYSAAEKEITDAKNAGAYRDTEFKTTDLQEYNVTPTDFSSTESSLPGVSATPWD